MKKILIIAPKSYPVIDAEAIVNIKLLTALSRNGGFEIDLISKMQGQDYPSDSLSSYSIKLNQHFVIEVANSINLLTIWQHVKAFLIFKCTFVGAHWAVKALPVMKQLLKHNKYDYVLTKNSPSLLLGQYAQRKYGVRWVATWNDPAPAPKYPHPYGKGWDAKLGMFDKFFLATMRKADVHIFPSSRLRDYMEKFLLVDPNKCIVIPHVSLNVPKNDYLCKNIEELKLVHSGNLKAPRDPRPFLRALSKFHTLYPKRNINVTFMGVYDDDIPSQIRSLQLDAVVSLTAPVSYNDSLNVLNDYHVCLIIEANCEEGVFLPTKVSDFFQCGKSIFALSPKVGVLKDLYDQKLVPYCTAVDDEEAIYNTICKIYYDFEQGVLTQPQQIIPDVFSENYIARQYSCL